MTTNSSQNTNHPNEEPEITQEDSVPSDGKDVEGEQMMKKVSNKKMADGGEDSAGAADKSLDSKRD